MTREEIAEMIAIAKRWNPPPGISIRFHERWHVGELTVIVERVGGGLAWGWTFSAPKFEDEVFAALDEAARRVAAQGPPSAAPRIHPGT